MHIPQCCLLLVLPLSPGQMALVMHQNQGQSPPPVVKQTGQQCVQHSTRRPPAGATRSHLMSEQIWLYLFVHSNALHSAASITCAAKSAAVLAEDARVYLAHAHSCSQGVGGFIAAMHLLHDKQVFSSS